VEAAIALPVALLLLLLLVQSGGLLKTYAATTNAARFAGRAAAIAGTDGLADQQILARIDAEAAGIRPSRIRSIVVWHAAGPGDPVPAPCRLDPGTAASTTSLGDAGQGVDAIGACNVYLNPDLAGGALDMAAGRASHPASYYFGCQGGSDPAAGHLVDCRWPGKDRRAIVSTRDASTTTMPDFVGVRIEVEHRFPVALPLRALTISQSTITMIEPRGYSLS
jgi:hypothetical protein